MEIINNKMNNNEINTCCSGFQLLSKKDITKKEFVELCNNLQNEFNKYYNTNDYSFSPECISEGGIIFDNFNTYNNGYKTMRIYFTDKKNICREKSLYGFINKNIKDEWINDDSILIEKNKYLGTYLKSYRNALEWTNEELQIFKKCFENIELIIKKTPTKKELKNYNNSNYYLNLFNLK